MLFQSPEYVLLLAGCILAVILLPHRGRWPVLLAASYLFYGHWRVDFLALLAASTVLDYGCGLALGRLNDGWRRRAVLALSLAGNLSILIWFKYRLFFGEALGVVAPVTGGDVRDVADFILPAGLSFYTLQTIGYTIDVYRRRVRPERHLGYFALYVAYFPQLVAGPIERAGRLLPQLRADRPFDWDRMRSGGLLFLFGLLKKLVVADHMAPAIGTLFRAPEAVTPGAAVILVLVSLPYILMDFSAYTDMARGSARMMGIDLVRNFRLPLGAVSIRDFWKRWHISLSQWIFDYLYAPLAGRSRNPVWRLGSLFVTFVVIGLWHGPAWTFVLFGAFHGALAVGELLVARLGMRWPAGRGWDRLRVARTYLLVSLSTILFLAPDMAAVGGVLLRLGDAAVAALTLTDPAGLVPVALFRPGFMLAVAGAVLAGWIDIAAERGRLDRGIGHWPVVARWALYYTAIVCAFVVSAGPERAFIYFQF